MYIKLYEAEMVPLLRATKIDLKVYHTLWIKFE